MLLFRFSAESCGDCCVSNRRLELTQQSRTTMLSVIVQRFTISELRWLVTILKVLISISINTIYNHKKYVHHGLIIIHCYYKNDCHIYFSSCSNIFVYSEEKMLR